MQISYFNVIWQKVDYRPGIESKQHASKTSRTVISGMKLELGHDIAPPRSKSPKAVSNVLAQVSNIN